MSHSYRRLLIKFSGEVLKGNQSFGIDASMLDHFCKAIKSIHKKGYELSLVIGGGNIFRGIQGAARGFDRVSGDYLGMLATVMNGIFLREYLHSHEIPARVLSGLSVPGVVEDFYPGSARQYLSEKQVLIFAGGTGNPYFTTDTAAALRAAEIQADIFVKATKVDGVYDSDPVENPGARLIPELSFSRYLQMNLKVLDGTAVSLSRDNNIPIAVLRFDSEKNSNIMEFLKGRKVGTLIGG